MQSAPQAAIAAEGAQVAAEAIGQPRFVTYRVFATQYEPNTAGAVEVALPDRCVKFASLGNTSALASGQLRAGLPPRPRLPGRGHPRQRPYAPPSR